MRRKLASSSKINSLLTGEYHEVLSKMSTDPFRQKRVRPCQTTLTTLFLASVVRWFSKDANEHLSLLVDKTKLIAGWKAPMVTIPLQPFCEYVYQEALGVLSKQNQRPARLAALNKLLSS